MSGMDREMKEVCEGGTRASLLDHKNKAYRTNTYIEDTNC